MYENEILPIVNCPPCFCTLISQFFEDICGDISTAELWFNKAVKYSQVSSDQLLDYALFLDEYWENLELSRQNTLLTEVPFTIAESKNDVQIYYAKIALIKSESDRAKMLYQHFKFGPRD